MKTLREMMDLIESAQMVAEEASRDYLKPQWPDQRALPKAVAKLLLQYAKQNKKSINRLIKASPFDLIDVIVEINPEFAEDNLDHLSDNDFNWVFLKATEMIAKSIQKQGVAEDEAQEYTVRVVDEEGSGYTVKVTATSEQGALHKAIVRVRNSGARPEHARIIRQDIEEEQLKETETDPVRRIEELFRNK